MAPVNVTEDDQDTFQYGARVSTSSVVLVPNYNSDDTTGNYGLRPTDLTLLDNTYVVVFGIPIALLVIVVVFMFCIILYIMNRLGNMTEQVDYHQYNLNNKIMSSESFKVYNGVAKKKRNKKHDGVKKDVKYNKVKATICQKYYVVGFNEEKFKDYISLINRCLSEKVNVEHAQLLEKRQICIKKCKDVRKIPKCDVIIVFIDKNEKDKILEDPNEGEEDLRLLTVKVCMLNDADVFVVYCDDEGSENLMPGLLYNPQIACVTEQPDLKELEKKDRVITCHRGFTITQREKIAEAISTKG